MKREKLIQILIKFYYIFQKIFNTLNCFLLIQLANWNQAVIVFDNFYSLTCLILELGPLEHAGENCWNRCNTRQGKCRWCGTDGWCCSMASVGNGCDGTFGGENGHICTLKPGKLSSFFLYLFIIFA